MVFATIRSKFFCGKQGRAPPPYQNKLTYGYTGNGDLISAYGKRRR